MHTTLSLTPAQRRALASLRDRMARICRAGVTVHRTRLGNRDERWTLEARHAHNVYCRAVNMLEGR